MQSKSAIQVFAIALTLVCIYQLSFTWVTQGVEQDAKDIATEYVIANPQGLDSIQASQDSIQAYIEQHYLDSIATEPVYDLLIKQYTYKECKDRELNLGLDLKGGMNVTLEVSVVEVIEAMSNHSKDETFLAALDSAKAMGRYKDEDFVTLFGEAYQALKPNGKLSDIFSTRENQDKIAFGATNEEVLEVIATEANGAISRSFEILKIRIDKFGVSQPRIQQLETSGRILVELPGIKDPKRAEALLQMTAKLEFWETYENSEIYNYLPLVNSKIKNILNFKSSTAGDDSMEAGTAGSDDSEGDTSEEGLAAAQDASSTQDSAEDKGPSDGLLSLIEGGSASDTGLTDRGALSAKENPLFSILTPAIYQNEAGQYDYGIGPVIGLVAIKDTAQVNAYFSMEQVKSIFPRNFRWYWAAKPYDDEKKFMQLLAIKVSDREGRAPLEGDVIVDAYQDYGQFSNQPEITMVMDAEGTKIWKRLTAENIDKAIAIVMDDRVYSFPTVNSEIPNGRSNISGSFTIKEAKDIALVLKAGKLPAPARIVEKEIVGPSLGQEAIDDGLKSFLIALLVVLAYMIFYYNKAGIVSNIALLANIFFIFGVLASLGAVLTLPGIAGIVLTIGMSIDANVLIYERIREELRGGKGIGLAIEDGYKNAYTSIIDANVTTLLVGIILYYFGSGPIKGFATTLIIGILTSLFSAIFITRLIFISFLKRKKGISLATKLTKDAFTNLNLQILPKRKIFYGISTIIILGGLASLYTRGLNKGVDFTGGRSYVVRFMDPVNTQQVQSALKDAFGSSPEVKTYGPKRQVKITTKYLIEDDGTDSDQKVLDKLHEGLTDYSSFEVMKSQKVGPTIADDIKRGAMWSTIVGLLMVFLYIMIRFKKWQFGLGALAALFHDVLIVLSTFSLLYGVLPFSLEMDQAFIAALLTVIGYSINDTVVVFDRIREYLGLYPKRDIGEVMNMAINSTISRTFNTSISTFAVLLVIFLLGGEVIKGFSFALLLGIVVGTYSSICIATPIALDTFKKLDPVGKKK
ncbi:MAG: protein translocase subunit SecDF [Flavobacteriales bacterium]|nr:protein translocase subunit SecDF [Flavobacteriales bacterium]